MEIKPLPNNQKITSDSINLVPTEKFTEEPVSKFLRWAETSGKVIVVLTEAVVLMVFFARFKIDAEVLDLKQEMTAKAQLLQSLKGLEEQFTALQQKLQLTANLYAKTFLPNDKLVLIEKNIPTEVFLESLQITPQKITLQGKSNTYNNIYLFWQNLKKQSEGQMVNLISLGRNESVTEGQTSEINFTLQIENQPKPATESTAPSSSSIGKELE